MASLAAASTSTAATCFVQKTINIRRPAAAARVQGLPSLSFSRVVCSVERKERNVAPQIAAASAMASVVVSFPALAVVDERLGGEGTGQVLGLSDPALGWIFFGVITLVWALYFVFSQGLPEGDDDSGLSL